MRRNAAMIAALGLMLSVPGTVTAAMVESLPKPRRQNGPHDLTDSDRENLAAAQAKRERRALKLESKPAAQDATTEAGKLSEALRPNQSGESS